MWKHTWRRWARGGGCSTVGSARIAAGIDAWLPVGVTVTAFHALGDEPLLDSIVDERRRWLAPRIDGDTMTFHDWSAATEMVAFGLRQPTAAMPAVPASEIDIMIIPGLAFDRTGIRLGRGGGFYDRFLAAHPVEDTVGVIPAVRFVEALPREPHDAAMAWIATESGVRSVGST